MPAEYKTITGITGFKYVYKKEEMNLVIS